MPIPAQKATKPWLESVVKKAASLWEDELKSLFLDVEKGLPDIIWDAEADTGDQWKVSRKMRRQAAIGYAKTTPDFGAKKLSSSAEAVPKGDSAEHVSRLDALTIGRLKTPYNYKSSTRDLRGLYNSVNPLHGLKDETLFEGVPSPDHCVDNLRQIMVSMWRTQLNVDVRITIPVWTYYNYEDGTDPHDALFGLRSHRSLLSLRSPYFHRVLANEPTIATLPLPGLPIFTSLSLSIILGYLYTGILRPSHEEYDLQTAFYIFRGSQYLLLPVLEELISAEIIVEMLHGLYHASLPDNHYRRLVGGKWSTMVKLGCQCGSCAWRVPRVLQFALEDSIKNDILERGARRGLVGLFGEGWCTEEFSALSKTITQSILTNLEEMITPSNVLPLLFAAGNATIKLHNSRNSWNTHVESTILSARGSIDKVLCANAQTWFSSKTWRNQMEDAKGVAFGRVTWVLEAISRGANQRNAVSLYQALAVFADSHKQRGPSVLTSLSIRTRIERTQAELKMTQLPYLWTPPSVQIPPLNISEASSLKSSTASFYSCISTPSRVLSLNELMYPGYSTYVAALDLATISLYSLASSRTISTDYGVYYTRRAISQETIQDWESSRTGGRRRSWDSFQSEME